MITSFYRIRVDEEYKIKLRIQINGHLKWDSCIKMFFDICACDLKKKYKEEIIFKILKRLFWIKMCFCLMKKKYVRSVSSIWIQWHINLVIGLFSCIKKDLEIIRMNMQIECRNLCYKWKIKAWNSRV